MLIAAGETQREDLDRYVERGGYLGLARAATEGPDYVLRAVKEAGIRGRGGSGRGEWTFAKWEEVARSRPGPRFVIANGAESNPESRKDHLLLSVFPHRVLEGLLIACYAVGAKQGFVYIKKTYGDALTSMQQAIAEAMAAGAWGPLDIQVLVYEAPDLPVAGEESAVVDVIEGFERPRPRLRPPEITRVGLYGSPTVVNNVETLAAVAAHLRSGEPVRTLLLTLTGGVHRPGVYEIPFGTPLRAVVEEWGGGATGPLRAVLPGGYLSGPLTPAELDLPLDYDGLLRAGTTLGPAVVHVVAGEEWEPRTAFAATAALWEKNSCGQCRLCQDGTAQLRRAAEKAAGSTGPMDREALELWALRLRGKGNCLYATLASRATVKWLRSFRDEL